MNELRSAAFPTSIEESRTPRGLSTFVLPSSVKEKRVCSLLLQAIYSLHRADKVKAEAQLKEVEQIAQELL